MKDKILNIIKDNIFISQYAYMNSGANLEGRDDAVDELTALMCYREVRLLFKITRPISSTELNQCAMTCITLLKSDYPEDIIMKCIDRIKAAMKS